MQNNVWILSNSSNLIEECDQSKVKQTAADTTKPYSEYPTHERCSVGWLGSRGCMSGSGERLRAEGLSRKRSRVNQGDKRQAGLGVCVADPQCGGWKSPRHPRRCSLTDLPCTGTETVEVTRSIWDHVFVNINSQTFIPLYLGLSHDFPLSFKR